MPSTHDILFGIVIPGLIAAFVLVVAWRPWRRGVGRRVDGRWGGAVALPLAFAVGYAAVAFGRQTMGGGYTYAPPRVPPADATHWIWLLLPLPLVLGLTDAIFKPKWWVRLPLVALAAVAVAKLVVPREPWGMTAIIAAGSVVLWALLEPLAERARGAAVPVAMWLAAVTAFAVITDGGSSKVGLHAATLAAAAGGAVVVGLLAKDLSLARGGVLAFSLLLPALLAAGHFYANVTPVHAAFTLLAPLGAWAVALPVVRGWRPWKRAAIALVATAVVAAPANVPAIQGLIKTAQEESRGGGVPY